VPLFFSFLVEAFRHGFACPQFTHLPDKLVARRSSPRLYVLVVQGCHLSIVGISNRPFSLLPSADGPSGINAPEAGRSDFFPPGRAQPISGIRCSS
jgi:hypothetical protein